MRQKQRVWAALRTPSSFLRMQMVFPPWSSGVMRGVFRSCREAGVLAIRVGAFRAAEL
jgi:hypothetical protein